MATEASPRTLVIACGALARELLAITRINGLDNVTVECLPAALHNRPSEIPEAVRARIRRARGQHVAAQPAADDLSTKPADPVDLATWADPELRFDRVFVGYADCGTGGLLDRVCEEEGVERLPGAHCYEFFATAPRFAELQDHQLGSFYLTDFLVKHFDRVVWQGLGIEDHPELLPMYFGNYTRLVYLAQTNDASLVADAERAAEKLGLDLTVVPSGYGELETSVVHLAAQPTPAKPTPVHVKQHER